MARYAICVRILTDGNGEIGFDKYCTEKDIRYQQAYGIFLENLSEKILDAVPAADDSHCFLYHLPLYAHVLYSACV